MAETRFSVELREHRLEALLPGVDSVGGGKRVSCANRLSQPHEALAQAVQEPCIVSPDTSPLFEPPGSLLEITLFEETVPEIDHRFRGRRQRLRGPEEEPLRIVVHLSSEGDDPQVVQGPGVPGIVGEYRLEALESRFDVAVRAQLLATFQHAVHLVCVHPLVLLSFVFIIRLFLLIEKNVVPQVDEKRHDHHTGIVHRPAVLYRSRARAINAGLKYPFSFT